VLPAEESVLAFVAPVGPQEDEGQNGSFKGPSAWGSVDSFAVTERAVQHRVSPLMLLQSGAVTSCIRGEHAFCSILNGFRGGFKMEHPWKKEKSRTAPLEIAGDAATAREKQIPRLHSG